MLRYVGFGGFVVTSSRSGSFAPFEHPLLSRRWDRCPRSRTSAMRRSRAINRCWSSTGSANPMRSSRRLRWVACPAHPRTRRPPPKLPWCRCSVERLQTGAIASMACILHRSVATQTLHEAGVTAATVALNAADPDSYERVMLSPVAPRSPANVTELQKLSLLRVCISSRLLPSLSWMICRLRPIRLRSMAASLLAFMSSRTFCEEGVAVVFPSSSSAGGAALPAILALLMAKRLAWCSLSCMRPSSLLLHSSV